MAPLRAPTTPDQPAAAPRRSRLALYLDLIRWNRPAGSYLLLWPTLSALWIAAQGFPGWHLLAVFVLGTFLARTTRHRLTRGGALLAYDTTFRRKEATQSDIGWRVLVLHIPQTEIVATLRAAALEEAG